MPELGQVSREQAASLAGLAPFVHQSGKRQGETHIGGGRSRLRRSLYAAALPAAFRWNPALVALYRRLTATRQSRTKPPLSPARASCFVFANTVIHRGTAMDRAAQRRVMRYATPMFLGSTARRPVPSSRPAPARPPRAARSRMAKATAKRRASVLDLREHGGTLEPAGKTNRHPILMVATLALG